jgi:urease accessory protein
MNRRYVFTAAGLLAALILVPLEASAHTGAGDTSGFGAGFVHPLGGIDHLLAMVAVGLWAAQLGGRAALAVPGTFVTLMLVGGFLGFSGVALPFVEQGILLSVLVMGILIAGAFRLPALSGAILVGLFALFHGHAHGSEMAAGLGATSYSLGFTAATLLLHVAGWGCGRALQRLNLTLLHRFAGGAIALGGGYLALA